MMPAPAVSGPVRFARFALPPNQLGYCGPGDDGALEHYVAGHEDPGLRELAAGFEGAYPYLQLLAGAHGCHDPLDPDVVEAYWIGNELLGEVSGHDFGVSIDERFRARAGSDWRHLAGSVPGGIANHAYHVFHVMPWAGLLRDGIVDEPLRIVDHCRISWATVLEAPNGASDDTVVTREPLVWSGSRLMFGTPTVETIRCSFEVAPGDVVAVHWDWACERLRPRQLAWLRHVTAQQIATCRAG